MRSVEDGISNSREEQEYLAAPMSASPTTSSFEGRYTTAAMAIRSMLLAPSSFASRKVDSPISPPSPETGRASGRGWLSDSPGSSGERDYGRRENLEGDKMMCSIARDVILSSIVGDSPSSPNSTPLEGTLSSIGQISSPDQPIVSPPSTDSSQLKSSSSSNISSPCPATIPRPDNVPRAGRQSLVRYLQDGNRIRAASGIYLNSNYSDSVGSSCAIESASESENEMLPEPARWNKEDDHTSSTVFSLSSSNGSPCPMPVDRHVKMIGARGNAGDELGMRSSRSRKVAQAGKGLFNLPNTSAVGAWTQSILVDSPSSGQPSFSLSRRVMTDFAR